MTRNVTFGSRVRVDWEGSRLHGWQGIVTSIGPASYDHDIRVHFENGDELWVPEERLALVVRQGSETEAPASEENA